MPDTRGQSDPTDYLIIGGGSAGCVMASRLSERPDIRVTLIESGPTFTPASEPASITDLLTRSYLNKNYMWHDLTAVIGGDSDGARMPYIQPRVLGGGSSVNGMFAHRGLPGDYDEWRALGVEGWGWNDLLPFFRKLEADQDMDGPLHGKSGPLQIRRLNAAHMSPLEKALEEEWAERQIPARDDLNGLDPVGRFPVPLSIADGHRFSAARAYLPEAVQARPNLTILGNTSVSQILFEDGRAQGVTAVRDGSSMTIAARHVVVCAGTIGSPALLHRSGIGAASALMAAGIQPVADRPGVGANLQNHPTVMLAGHLRRHARIKGRRAPYVNVVRHSSGIPGCDEADMFAPTMAMSPDATPRNPLGRQLAVMMSIVHKPYSRGTVSPSRTGDPQVVFNMFGDERDVQRLMHGWTTIRSLLTSRKAAPHLDAVFVPLSMGRSDDSFATAMFNQAAALALDIPPLRRRIMQRIGIPVEKTPAEGPAVRDWVLQCSFPAYHAVGTCRLGRADDPQAVVDDRCRVIGVRGVSVVDSSIFPTLMRAGTNIPAIMAGEKASQMMLEDAAHQSV